MRTDERNKSRDELAQSMPCKEEEDQRATKITSMKRAFILFWHGLTALLAGIANWFTVILGMRDDSKYGKIHLLQRRKEARIFQYVHRQTCH